MGNDPLKPRGAKNFQPDSKRFSKLKESLSRETNAIKGGIRGLRKISIGHPLSFLVQAVFLGRYESISTNKDAWWSLLNEINTFSEHVQQLQKRPGLREGMKVSIREAAKLIVEATLACCTQINASKFSRKKLAKFEKKLQEVDTHVRNQTDLCLFDAVRQPKSHSAKYPKYAVGIEKPVGIKEALYRVSKLLEWKSDKNAVAVILHGIGGMGKTTLADAVFSRLFEKKTEECKFCFVRLFQDIKSTPNVIELQKSILRQLKGEEPEEIRSYEEGQKQIAVMLEKEEAFIYIDNVLLPDKREQGPDALTQLLPKNMANAKKLRLLITTRDKDAARMTMSKGVEKKFYQIQSLPKVEAETLLRNELNGNKIQLNDSQIDGIVKICGGVPALLKVLAGFINGGEGSAVQNYETLMREAKEWKGHIGVSIEQYVFAYDKLEDELKDPFLDVCSFFRGWDWKELSDIVGDTKLKRLEQRALVTLDVKSMTARVPDVILQVGLQRTEGNRFRLTTATEIEKFLDVEDLQKIKGIWASDNKDPLRIPASKLDLMSGSLRVLKLGPLTDVEGKCEKKFKELVFFSAITSHLPFYVSKLKGFEKLRHLCYNPADLQNLSQMPSNLRHVDIKLNSPAFQVSSNCIQRLRNLRVLRLSNAQFKSLPQELGDMGNGLEKVSISGCQYLEELSISNCQYLEEVSISNCQYLEEFSISNCQYLEEVSISTLKSLRVLTMGRCSGLTQLAKGLGSLTSLQELDLYGCQSLEALPSELENLTSLQKLDLSRCISLKALPRSLGNLTSLQELRLRGCNSLQDLPNNLEGLSLLRLLDLSWCTNIENLPLDFQCLTSLEILDVRNCHKLEGKRIHSMLEMGKLQILSIAGSKLLEERWEKIQAQQCNQSWSCAVYTEQGLSNEENLLKQLQLKFDRMLTNGEREPLKISGLPLHTLLLVMFDGRQEFRPRSFPLPLLEESVDDIQTHFEMVYFGNHWDQLPKKVADRIVGHAPANRDAKALFQKLLSLVFPFETDFDGRVNGSFQMTAEIVSGKKGKKYLSSWKFSGKDGVEDFVVTKCGRYVKLKQLAERPGGSPITLLTELFPWGEEEISLSFLQNKDGESTKVGVDELQGKTILLDIRPANICFDIPLLALVEMYNVVKKERFNFEIITVPIMQNDSKLDVSVKFSSEVPWLVLENPWQLTNATKYFLLEGCPRRLEGWDSWYPNTMRIIKSDGAIAPYRNPGVLRMVNTWGAAAYPFTAEKEAELIQKEETQMKAMSHAMFLFQHLERVAEQLREATGQQKMICLCCCHEKEFTNSMKDVLTELSDIIYIIYIPEFQGAEGVRKSGYFTVKIGESFPLAPSKMSSEEMGGIFSLSLSEYEAMRFWARIRSLKEGIKAKDPIQLLEMLRIPVDSLYKPSSWMFIMDEDGNLITTKGKEIVKLLSEKYSDDRVKELMQQLLKGAPTGWKKTLLELEETLWPRYERYADSDYADSDYDDDDDD